MTPKNKEHKKRGRPKGSKNKKKASNKQKQKQEQKITKGYKPEYAHQAYIACSKGGLLTYEALAELFGVNSKSTIKNWVDKYPEFEEAIKNGNDDFNVLLMEDALKKSALGYDYKEKKIVEKDGKVLVREITEKHKAPNVTALIFGLKNRASNRWKDFKAIEVGNIDNKPFKTASEVINQDMTEKEASQAYLEYLKMFNSMSEDEDE